MLPDVQSPYRYRGSVGGPSDSEILESNREVISKLTGDYFSWTNNTITRPVCFEDRKINLIVLSKIFERDGYETYVSQEIYDELKPLFND